jgi:hypothetical protein
LIRRPTVLVLVDLIQDLDVLLPVIERLRDEPRLRLRVLVSRWLLKDAPRTLDTLKAGGLTAKTERRADLVSGRAPSLAGVAATVTASDSAAAPHRAGYALASRARALGRRTYTVQHGVELAAPGETPAPLASAVLFCWGPYGEVEAHPLGVEVVAVGRPWRGEPSPAPSPIYDLGVFENLHWDRYDEADRERFLTALETLLRARPGVRVLARAHPAGGWLDAHAETLSRFPNVTLQLSGASRESPQSGAAVVRSAARVITTPSTVALDAAQSGRPVALASPGGKAYAPLPVLTDPEGWIAFADRPPLPGVAETTLLALHVAPGDAAEEIASRIIFDLSRP